jgi:excisionase family DNA binding protein
MPDEIMTIREMALFLRMTEKSLYRYALEGKIPGFKVGGAWRFRKSQIDSWILAQEQRANQERGAA